MCIRDSLKPALQEIFLPCSDHVRFVGMTNRPEDYMAAADIFCLPSYREGFGSVIIEAAAAGIPAVASRIYGLTDAVDDGETGLLHAAADVDSIDSTLRTLVSDADLRGRMGAVSYTHLDVYKRQALGIAVSSLSLLFWATIRQHMSWVSSALVAISWMLFFTLAVCVHFSSMPGTIVCVLALLVLTLGEIGLSSRRFRQSLAV